MAKQSAYTEAKETVVGASKVAAEGVKNVATDALAAAAAAAAGVVVERVSQGLRTAEGKVQQALPSPQRAAQAAEQTIKRPTARKVAGKGRKKATTRVAVKSRKVVLTRKKKRAALPARKKAAAKAGARKKAATRKPAKQRRR
jgi:hypothetical protein